MAPLGYAGDVVGALLDHVEGGLVSRRVVWGGEGVVTRQGQRVHRGWEKKRSEGLI